MTRTGVVGLGYWGPNLARNFDTLADLTWICNTSRECESSCLAELPAGFSVKKPWHRSVAERC